MSASVNVAENQDTFFKDLNQQPVAVQVVALAFAAFVIFFSPVVTLTYLGTSFQSKTEVVNTDDWRRKFLIFQTWFFVVLSSLSLMFQMTEVSFTFSFAFSLVKTMVNIAFGGITLSYLGMTFAHSEAQLKTDDWRRKAIIAYQGYYALIVATSVFGYHFVYMNLMHKYFG